MTMRGNINIATHTPNGDTLYAHVVKKRCYYVIIV